MRRFSGIAIVGLIVLLLAACTTDPAERNNAANWYTAQGDYQAAVQAYTAAQVADPNNPLLYFNSAEAFARDAQLSNAIAALQQAVNRGDETLIADAYYNLGNLYFEQNFFPQAISAYRQVLLLEENNDAARFNLELANANLISPTPTAMEMRTEPEDQQADPSMTPTPDPGGQDEPPTPTPPPENPVGEERTGLAEAGEIGDDPRESEIEMQGPILVEDAKRVLDPVQFEQDSIGGLPDPLVTPGTPTSGKDW
jgi:tetratricopeptide (TPR) repeat protein